jgi:phosphoribosylaminoimidazolecarboxamide formyltransferase/IMP cyclohydrolase
MAGPRHDPSLYRDRDSVPVRRALVSVSDKTGLLDLAAALADAGAEIVSTGSTAATIRDAGFEVTDVAAVSHRVTVSHSTPAVTPPTNAPVVPITM